MLTRPAQNSFQSNASAHSSQSDKQGVPVVPLRHPCPSWDPLLSEGASPVIPGGPKQERRDSKREQYAQQYLKSCKPHRYLERICGVIAAQLTLHEVPESNGQQVANKPPHCPLCQPSPRNRTRHVRTQVLQKNDEYRDSESQHGQDGYGSPEDDFRQG